MPTNWDILHKRFATSIRDEISDASVDGAELTVSGRDSYLIYAYTKYIQLVALYNPGAVGRIIPELFKTQILTAASGVIQLPDDCARVLTIMPVKDYVDLEICDPDRYMDIKSSQTYSALPSEENIFASVRGTTIELLPQTNQIFEVGYIFKPANIFSKLPGSTDDILIHSQHWDSILQFARAQYFRDKYEFQVAQMIESDAILLSPVKVSNAKDSQN